MLILRAGQLGALWKYTSRLEGNYLISNWTNLNRVSNNKHCKYNCVILSSFGQTNQLTIGGNEKQLCVCNYPLPLFLISQWLKTLLSWEMLWHASLSGQVMETTYLVSKWTNLNRVSNNKHCKYNCVVLSSFGQTNKLTITILKQSLNPTVTNKICLVGKIKVAPVF